MPSLEKIKDKDFSDFWRTTKLDEKQQDQITAVGEAFLRFINTIRREREKKEFVINNSTIWSAGLLAKEKRSPSNDVVAFPNQVPPEDGWKIENHEHDTTNYK